MRLPIRPSALVPHALALGAAMAVSSGAMPTLRPESVAGWSRYVAATEWRISAELGSHGGFLAQDFGARAAADRGAVLAGKVVMGEMRATDASGREVDVPSAMVHHWRGAVLLPGATLDRVVIGLQQEVPRVGDDVLQAAILERRPDQLRVFLKIQRRKFVTAVFNTEHFVTFRRLAPSRASSTSTATRIAELEHPLTPQERELPPGQDRGFLWRWNAYWRYEQVPGGVIAECESISLSRDVPAVLQLVAGRFIRSTARESMERTLMALRARFAS